MRYLLALVTSIVLLQLILGAAMRHQHAGLAIPDFPLAYGKLWPAMDAESVAKYNQSRGEVNATNPITSAQIGLQMAHRMVACLILAAVAGVALWARRRFGSASILSRLSLAWFGLIVAQATLGAATIWTNKAADIATAHVAVGASSLASGVMLALIAARLSRNRPVSHSAPLSATAGLESSSAKAIA
jgi:cytochrome c oxidase assembly protein subunit 15